MADGDQTWGDPGQFNSPLAQALANLGIGAQPPGGYPVTQPTTGLAGTEHANLGFAPGAAAPAAPAAAAPLQASTDGSWGGPGQFASPLDAAIANYHGAPSGYPYIPSQGDPFTGFTPTVPAVSGFSPPGGGPPGGGPPGGGPMGPPGGPPGAPGTLPGRFPPPQKQFGPTPEQWAQFRQDGAAATQGINRMPYVFPGDQHSYQALATTPPADIFNMFYKPGSTPSAIGKTASSTGLDPATQALLGQFGSSLGGLGAAAQLGVLSGRG